jgi:predicted phosphodiesterase
MRYGIISDIHSNYVALCAVIKELNKESLDSIICLGDLVGYGPQPKECIQEIKKLLQDKLVVIGNHDLATIGKKEIEWFNELAKAAIIWTKKVIEEEVIGYLESLPEKIILPSNGEIRKILLAHGSLRDPTEEYLFPNSLREAYANFLTLTEKDSPGSILLVGHTHIPCGFEFNPKLRRLKVMNLEEDKSLPLNKDCDYILNPGAVGQPRDGNPAASFAILDTKDATFSIKRVNYKISETQLKMQKAGLPFELIYRLELGI